MNKIILMMMTLAERKQCVLNPQSSILNPAP